MRFLIKTAFWLALIAFFLPSPSPDAESRPGVNYFGAFLGAQEAISDMGGFCERSPAACEAGRDVGSYVAARVGDGIAYAYTAAQGAREASPVAQPVPLEAVGAAPKPDPMLTAAVGAEHVRRTAGLPPFGLPADAAAQEKPAPRPAGTVTGAGADADSALPPVASVLPTPAPRG